MNDRIDKAIVMKKRGMEVGWLSKELRVTIKVLVQAALDDELYPITRRANA